MGHFLPAEVRWVFCQKLAKIEPERLCHILNIAPGKAAVIEKYFMAKATLSPEFCMPTSMANVRQVR